MNWRVPHTPMGLRRAAEELSAPLPALLAEARRLAAAVIWGDHGQRRAGMGDEFWQYRPATSMDGVRRIDWRRSARTDAHFVRQTERQLAQSVLFWVAEGLSMRFTGDPARPEKGARARLLGLAASILLIRAGERVGLVALDDRPRTGEAQVMRLAEAMTRSNGAEDHSVPRAWTISPGSRAVFLSDFMGDLAPIERSLTQAADRGVSGALLQILDPVEEVFPFAGRTLFESMSGAISHETLKASGLRDRYLDRLAARKDRLSRISLQTGWHYTRHRTDAPAQGALLWLYRALERVRR